MWQSLRINGGASVLMRSHKDQTWISARVWVLWGKLERTNFLFALHTLVSSFSSIQILHTAIHVYILHTAKQHPFPSNNPPEWWLYLRNHLQSLQVFGMASSFTFTQEPCPALPVDGTGFCSIALRQQVSLRMILSCSLHHRTLGNIWDSFGKDVLLVPCGHRKGCYQILHSVQNNPYTKELSSPQISPVLRFRNSAMGTESKVQLEGFCGWWHLWWGQTS